MSESRKNRPEDLDKKSALKRWEKQRKIAETFKDKILNLNKQGFSMYKIKKETGVSLHYIKVFTGES